MEKLMVSVETSDSDSDNENTDVEYEEASEYEEHEEVSLGEESSEEPDEEDTSEDGEAQEVDSSEEPVQQELEEGPEDEEPSEDAAEESSEDEPGRSSDDSSQGCAGEGCAGKLNMPSEVAPGPKRMSELSGVQNQSNDKIVLETPAISGSSGRKRRSGWDMQPTSGNTGKKRHSGWDVVCLAGQTEGSTRKKKMRTKKNPKIPVNDYKISIWKEKLCRITDRLQSGVVDERPENERSPSPPPFYNDLGIRINTREARLRSKLLKQRQIIISGLLRRDPNFRQPRGFQIRKHQKMIRVPAKEYPGYNFVGIILGPRGNTIRRMEKETGARIKLRARGSDPEGEQWKKRPLPSCEEDMYVIVEADTRYSFDTAVAMVEKLMVPVEEGHNVHKLSQLRELAELKGSLRSSRAVDQCNTCGDASHFTSACPLTAPTTGARSDDQVSFFAEMGSGLSSFISPPLRVLTASVPSSAAPVSKPEKATDDRRIFVAKLPPVVDDAKLTELFSPFGPISEVKVIMDRSTGTSKEFGFVTYTHHADATKAVAKMNGFVIDWKRESLLVRIAANRPPPINKLTTNSLPQAIPQATNPAPPPVNGLPTYPGPRIIPQNTSPATPPVDSLPTYPGPKAIPPNINPTPTAGASSDDRVTRFRNGNCVNPALTPGAISDDQVSFFTGIGGGLSSFISSPVPVLTAPVSTSATLASEPEKATDGNIFVANLPSSLDDTKLIELFSPFGPISQVKLIRDWSTGLSKGYGFVTYTHHVDAGKAVAQMNGFKIDLKTLVVRIAGIRPPQATPQNINPASPLASKLLTYPVSQAIPQAINPAPLAVNRLPAYPGPQAIQQNINPTLTPGASLDDQLTQFRNVNCENPALTPGVSADDQVSFFTEMGGGLSSFISPPTPVVTAPVPSSAASVGQPEKAIEDGRVFIANLPSYVDDTRLIELFSPFGPIAQVNVVRDKSTGFSKEYGFVTYTHHADAGKAVAQMNGVKVDWNIKRLVVRIASSGPSPVNKLPTHPGPPSTPQSINPSPPSVNKLPTYSGRPAITQNDNPAPIPVNRLPTYPRPQAIAPNINPTPAPAASSDDQLRFFTEMRGGLCSFISPVLTAPVPSSAAPVSRPEKTIEDGRIFVANLPSHVDDNKLIELFSPFGPIVQVKVLRDMSTGLSKRSGFVTYTHHVDAGKAVAQMNGVSIDTQSKALVVRIAGSGPPSVNKLPAHPGLPSTLQGIIPAPPTVNRLPTYPGPQVIPQNSNPTPPPVSKLLTYSGTSAVPQNINPAPKYLPRPSESRLPETVAPFSKLSFSGQYSASLAPSSRTPTPSSLFPDNLRASDGLAYFPGCLKSLDPSPRLYHQPPASSSLSSSSSSQVHGWQNFGSYHMPPS